MAADTRTGSATASAVPTIALGLGFAPAAFAPGRYATAIQRTMFGTHDVQVLNEDSTSSFVLDLAADGTATACRGWRYVFRNDGPEIHTEDRYREQQGYRGPYKVVDGVADLVLSIDNAVCPHVFEGELALPRASSLTLRCLVATSSGAGALPVPVLLCQSVGSQPLELDRQVVPEMAPAGWFALGSGNGMLVRVSGRPKSAHWGDEVTVTVNVADTPLRANVWERSF